MLSLNTDILAIFQGHIMVFSQMDYGGPHENGTIHLVPIANPQPAGGIVVSSANVKSEPQNPQTSVHVQMPNVQYIQEPGGVSVSYGNLYCN